jgi:16S rRNA (adenine1518-N6/adenine1519-N6)-dimethyltransferase
LLPLYSPRVVRSLLERYGIQPQKRWGQNFLVDGNVLVKIVNAANLTPDDVVLEIGPGLGVLTRALAERARAVVAIEKDSRLVAALQATLHDLPNVRIVPGDALDVSFETLLLERATRNAHQATGKVVSNLPYSISKPVLQRLVAARALFSLMVLTVQKEVAERLTATPGTKAYGALSVITQAWMQIEMVSLIPPKCFYPAPEVSSAMVRLIPHPAPLILPAVERDFLRLVRAAFQERRKTIGNALAPLFPNADKSVAQQFLVERGVDPRRRGETLSVAEFARLAESIGVVGVME